MDLSKKKKFVEDLLYWRGQFEYLNSIKNVESITIEMLSIIRNIQDSEALHLYAYNYNWDDGFNIPNAIIDNPNCDVSTALMIFFIGDNSEYLWYGSRYGKGLPINEYNQKWVAFISKLVDKLINKDFKSNGIAFENPLSKSEKYQLGKDLTDTKKEVFFQSIDGKDLNIYL